MSVGVSSSSAKSLHHICFLGFTRLFCAPVFQQALEEGMLFFTLLSSTFIDLFILGTANLLLFSSICWMIVHEMCREYCNVSPEMLFFLGSKCDLWREAYPYWITVSGYDDTWVIIVFIFTVVLQWLYVVHRIWERVVWSILLARWFLLTWLLHVSLIVIYSWEIAHHTPTHFFVPSYSGFITFLQEHSLMN